MRNAKGYNPETGEWNDSLTGDYLWSSVNTPDVMTPYSWSGIRHGFAQMMLPGFLPIENICGRVYNNASVGATVFHWAADPKRRTDIYHTLQRIKTPFTQTIQGMPGSAGHAEGRVRILSSPEEGGQLQPGEILVTVTTNVGWTPIFLRAAAVIADVGAPLSHAAVVVRELGIPAVVGCFNATALLKTGDNVRVDGSQGTVTLL
jgi:phosphohistidine swiveling domain-containing protein